VRVLVQEVLRLCDRSVLRQHRSTALADVLRRRHRISGNSSATRYGEAVVDIGDGEQYVIENYLGAVNSKYWIVGSTLNAVLAVSIFWLG
jgi:hypothetical protein